MRELPLGPQCRRRRMVVLDADVPSNDCEVTAAPMDPGARRDGFGLTSADLRTDASSGARPQSNVRDHLHYGLAVASV